MVNIFFVAKVEKKCRSGSGINTGKKVPFWWCRRFVVSWNGRCAVRVGCCWWWFCQVRLLSVDNESSWKHRRSACVQRLSC